jgi:hypothetical protein
MVDMIYAKLVENNLHTIDLASKDIPIIMLSFDIDALLYMKTKSDLPNTLAMGPDRSNLT